MSKTLSKLRGLEHIFNATLVRFVGRSYHPLSTLEYHFCVRFSFVIAPEGLASAADEPLPHPLGFKQIKPDGLLSC